MAIHDAGMFTVKGINRLKILQDAIDRNLHPGQAAEMLGITPRLDLPLYFQTPVIT
ncbi:hypothetical protein [Salmonella enterica]|uniref:hypothetical protein n=1 Tax=Salmonella enterica TaxID=28901 RepID=UPI002FD1920D